MAEPTGPYSLGILGCGHMGAALLKGLRSLDVFQGMEIMAYDANPAALESLFAQKGIVAASDEADLLAQCQAVVLAVKPQVWLQAVSSMAPKPDTSKIVLSIMAGVSSAQLKAAFPSGYSIVRAMPNLPLAVGEGATAIEVDGHREEILVFAERVFGAVGRCTRVQAWQMDAVTALSGSGPMYVFEFIEGLILGGVKAGLPREAALSLVTQTVRGALALLEKSTDHPAQWSARVCSPGGTTIHALHALEQTGFRGALISAVEAAAKRSRDLGG